MEVVYYKEYSQSLGREMEWKRYGSKGRPVLFIPCQNGRFYDFENYQMADVWAPWINSGQVMVFSADTIDQETWSKTDGDPRSRILRHESWVFYLTRELAPRIREIANQLNGWEGYPFILITGLSLGAFHAANLYFRFPDIFDGLMALSGIYSASFSFGTYHDDLVDANSPVDYLARMPKDHPFINWYNQKKTIICTGQGPWEIPDCTRQLDRALAEKGIHAWVDYWGYDCSHDWPWWYKQTAYFVPYLLGQRSD